MSKDGIGAEACWKVFRLRGIPSHVSTCDEVASLLTECFRDITASHISVNSIATSLNVWENPRSRVATLQFTSVPSVLKKYWKNEYWDLCNLGSNSSLILDCQFLGLTPLNDVPSVDHVADCVAISGLGSHPFGSWQPRGPDKSFMWIRDEASIYTPGVRMMIYGYDSSLIDSDSFQLISDIAREFIEHLRMGGWALKEAKPVVFLAHSLGGLVLKDALVQIADARNNLDRSLIDKIRGAIMFGVPNLGMEQSYLLAVVEGQPNETLIQDLTRNSNYLLRLDESFSGTAFLSKVTIFWAYEQQQSHTVVIKPGGVGIDRRGPLAILVSRHSATCRMDQNNPSLTFPINRDHSQMVKFTRGHDCIKMVCFKIMNIIYSDPIMISSERISASLLTKPIALKSKNTSSWITVFDIIESLDAPDLDLRRKIIEDQFETTFEWIFKHKEFLKWLGGGTGMFWINGKPGSGKSTLMKFIVESSRTKEVLHNWKDGRFQILAGFFFHYRGSAMGKSFEGLLRSLLRQFLQQHDELFHLLSPFFSDKRKTKIRPSQKKWTLLELEQAVREICTQTKYPLDICLFFDALDEFDGHPELICRFLKEIIEVPANSATSIKVCFSSRPWEVFLERFSDYPKMTLQEHTQTDIRDYCVGMISKAVVSTDHLRILVPMIVQRASGVFLRVSLVVKDLLNVVSDPAKKANSLEKLKEILFSLPLELDEYYDHIIHRMGRSHRWETYVLLDLVTRASNSGSSLSLSPNYVCRAIAVSSCDTYQMAAENIVKNSETSVKWEKQIYLWGGGLVEVKLDVVQVMHQTIFDFATSLKFKELVLGNLAKITHENGHVFHMKYLLTELGTNKKQSFWDSHRQLDELVAYHARRAEATTGISQERFITSVPVRIFSKICSTGTMSQSGGPIIPWHSRLGFAAWASLILYLNDAAKSQPKSWLKTCLSDPLIELSITGLYSFPDADIEAAAITLLQNGYDIKKDPNAIDNILTSLRVTTDDTMTERMWTKLCLLILEYGQSVHTRIMRLSLDGVRDSNWVLPLHIAPPEIAQKLLELGADPNSLDSFGHTPLDSYMNFEYGVQMKRFKVDFSPSGIRLEELYELCRLVIEKGGRIRKTPLDTCENTLQWFQLELGRTFDIQDLW